MTPRKSLEELTLKIGNRLVPHMPLAEMMVRGFHRTNNVDYGLGDFLTQNITFRKVGATAGALAPVGAMYAFWYTSASVQTSANPHAIAALMTAGIGIGTFPYTVASMLFGGELGYFAGGAIDKKLGDSSIEHTHYDRVMSMARRNKLAIENNLDPR